MKINHNAGRKLLNWQNTAIIVVIYVLLSSWFSCNQGRSTKTEEKQVVRKDTLIKGDFERASGIVFDSTLLDQFITDKPDFKAFASDFRNFYRLRKYNYVWYDKKGLSETANNLVTQLNHQKDEGILKDIPYRKEFNERIAEVIQNGVRIKPDLITELMLTGQYFNYARNVWGGAESDKAGSIGWYLPRKKLAYADLLQENLSGKKELNVEESAVIPQYVALKEMLGRLQQLDKDGKEIKVVYSAALKNLRPGDTLQAIGLIRKRLYQLGDLPADNAGTTYDNELQNAVISFKERHGIAVNSTITSRFIQELNIPARQRSEQIMVNLERFRWIPVDNHSDEFILINIPEYKLHYYENEKDVWDCNVVVGKAMTKTVIFSGSMSYIVFSPYWYLPPSIIQKEVKPGIARNPNYLANHRMEWNGGNVRQKPGSQNSLGLVKFIFPNSNNIYLHDTPAKSLFTEDNRAFSHGCVRVSQPRELAIRILRNDSSWTPDKIDAAMHAGYERTANLKKKIPVYIGYFTAFVDAKGKLNFRNDVYGRDSRLLNMLMEN